MLTLRAQQLVNLNHVDYQGLAFVYRLCVVVVGAVAT